MSTKLDFSKMSLMDALDLAALIEIEACRRYTLFAEQLGSRGSDDAGSVFAAMVVNESKHGEELAKRRMALFGDKAPNVRLDDIFDVEAPDVTAPSSNMSQFRAYQIALMSEEKAYAFYDGALRYVTQPEVKKLFEELREEEAEHVQMLKDLMVKLPREAANDLEDLDEDKYRRERSSY